MGRRDRIGDPLRSEQLAPASAVESVRDSAEPVVPATTARHISSTDERLAAIEATMSALIFSTFGARDSAGQLLKRCRCGLFATRINHVEHRVAGSQIECLCDSCVPASPLAVAGVPQRDVKLLNPGDESMVRGVNAKLEQARLWGAS